MKLRYILTGAIVAWTVASAATAETRHASHELPPVINQLRGEFFYARVPREADLRLDSNWSHCKEFNASTSESKVPIMYIEFRKFNGLIQFTRKSEPGWVEMASPEMMAYGGTNQRHRELYGTFEYKIFLHEIIVPRKLVARIMRDGSLIMESTYLPGYFSDDEKYPLAISFRSDLAAYYIICPANKQ